MNDPTGGGRRSRRASATAVATAVTMLAAACGGGSASSSSSGAPAYAQELALARCMRGHGVPDFPDPSASGGYNLTSNGLIEGAGGSPVDINSSQAQAAYGKCRHVLPGAPSLSQLEQRVQQAQQARARMLPQVLKWEQCIRSHGEPNFSIPLGGQSQAPGNGAAINPNSPRFQAALSACHHLLPPGVNIHMSTSSRSAAPSAPAS